MRKTILALLLCLSVATTSCVQRSVTATPKDTAVTTLYTTGVVFKSTKDVFDLMYSTNKISRDDYNIKFVPEYNQALASYKIAVMTLQALPNGTDPNTDPLFLRTLTTFLSDKQLVDNLAAAMKVDPKTGLPLTQ